jgi:protein O-GlcNAc transferase
METLRRLLSEAIAARGRGDLDAALAAGRQVAERLPGEAAPLQFLGEVLAGLGRLDEALENLNAAVGLAPADPVLRRAAALVAVHGGRPGQAAEHLAAIPDPTTEDLVNLTDALVTLAGELIARNRHPEAEAPLLKALDLAPDDPATLTNLALVHLDRGDPAAAEALARRAITGEAPPLAAGLALAGALHAQGRSVEALAVAEDAAGRAGRDEPHVADRLAAILTALGRADEAVAVLCRALAAHPESSARLADRLLFVLPHAEATKAADILAAAPSVPAAVAPLPKRTRRAGERLRIGYLSPDFRGHALAYFLAPLIESHDRGRVAVTCYSETKIEDGWTERFRRAADHWRDSRGVSDRELAEMIRADGIDVLVDCAGRTAGNRLGVMAYRPAARQGSLLLGAGMTSGRSDLDVLLTDGRLSPDGAEADFSEPLLRLPHAVAPFAPDPAWPAVAPMPEAKVFGCFANPSRLSPGLLAQWRRILDQCPGWSLLLAHPAYADVPVAGHWLRVLEAAGLAGRTELRPLGGQWTMEVYGEVAIILDTFPVSGATTSLIALWMGVPVVSRYGPASWQRFGHAILSDMGLAELSAPDGDGYVAAASLLAADRGRLISLRAGLRDVLRDSPLCDGPARARDVENALVW